MCIWMGERLADNIIEIHTRNKKPYRHPKYSRNAQQKTIFYYNVEPLNSFYAFYGMNTEQQKHHQANHNDWRSYRKEEKRPEKIATTT